LLPERAGHAALLPGYRPGGINGLVSATNWELAFDHIVRVWLDMRGFAEQPKFTVGYRQFGGICMTHLKVARRPKTGLNPFQNGCRQAETENTLNASGEVDSGQSLERPAGRVPLR
jgi:hypothetical protein